MNEMHMPKSKKIGMLHTRIRFCFKYGLDLYIIYLYSWIVRVSWFYIFVGSIVNLCNVATWFHPHHEHVTTCTWRLVERFQSNIVQIVAWLLWSTRWRFRGVTWPYSLTSCDPKGSRDKILMPEKSQVNLSSGRFLNCQNTQNRVFLFCRVITKIRGSMENSHKSMQNMIITNNNILICWNMHQ
jgi:hypothetical protein